MTVTDTSLEALVPCRVVTRGSVVDLRFELHLDAPLDEVWRALTASPYREHWIPCAALDDLRGAATVQPPLWPMELPRTSGDSPAFTGITRVWDAPSVFEWTTELGGMRWELAAVGAETHLGLSATIAAAPDAIASVSADTHVAFEQLSRLVIAGRITTPTCGHYVELARLYGAAIDAARRV